MSLHIGTTDGAALVKMVARSHFGSYFQRPLCPVYVTRTFCGCTGGRKPKWMEALGRIIYDVSIVMVSVGVGVLECSSLTGLWLHLKL